MFHLSCVRQTLQRIWSRNPFIISDMFVKKKLLCPPASYKQIERLDIKNNGKHWEINHFLEYAVKSRPLLDKMTGCPNKYLPTKQTRGPVCPVRKINNESKIHYINPPYMLLASQWSPKLKDSLSWSHIALSVKLVKEIETR